MKLTKVGNAALGVGRFVPSVGRFVPSEVSNISTAIPAMSHKHSFFQMTPLTTMTITI